MDQAGSITVSRPECFADTLAPLGKDGLFSFVFQYPADRLFLRDCGFVLVLLFVFFSIFHSLPLDVLPIGPTRKLTQTIKKNLFSFETLNLRPLFLRNCLLTQRTTRILIDERV